MPICTANFCVDIKSPCTRKKPQNLGLQYWWSPNCCGFISLRFPFNPCLLPWFFEKSIFHTLLYNNYHIQNHILTVLLSSPLEKTNTSKCFSPHGFCQNAYSFPNSAQIVNEQATYCPHPLQCTPKCSLVNQLLYSFETSRTLHASCTTIMVLNTSMLSNWDVRTILSSPVTSSTCPVTNYCF